MTVHDGSLIAADEETIGGVNTAPVSPLVSMLGIPAEANIDVINDDNAETYWERSDRFDMAIDLTAGRDGPRGARAKRCGAGSRICSASTSPSSRSTELRERQSHLVCRARRRRHQDRRPCCGTARTSTRQPWRAWSACSSLTFRDPAIVLDKVRGEPVYLILAMTPDRLIRMKPQNLVTGLPIRHLEAVG